ncbi:MAG: hypothetical protein IKO42_08360, partial [Opitutales bacterium]|nr:hypothetical protein [Opitutales bacterium]
MQKLKISLIALAAFAAAQAPLFGQSKHGTNPIHPTYTGKIMAGYQGWFRAKGDGSGRGWVHWGQRGFSPENCTVEALPFMDEYEFQYESGISKDGKPVKV